MPLAPSFHTVAYNHIPLLSSITDTPPPASSLAKSSIGSQASIGTGSASMPELGQEFCGFHIVEELGHGTFARVYLAKQAALAGREVALKVTRKPTLEPERLARLQHTNVVPVYSVHNSPTAQLICMPYLGRRTLADSLSGFRKSHAAIAGLSTRKGLATKKNASVSGSSRSHPVDPDQKSGMHAAATPSADSIVGKVAEVLPILLQLADGLAHAHDRGVLHLDLKPANVLVADTGEPMLLDFNLSFAEAEGKREVVGGTIPYMAPEQLLDLKQRGKGSIDARTDLYSLGVMAFELLTGKHPFPVTSRSLTEFDGLIAARNLGAPALREVNPDAPAAVEAIVNKLLAPNPADRYQTARELREDLDRQLTDRPLKFAADRSIVERVGKWRRRNPKLMVAAIVAAALTVAGGAGAFAFSETEKRATTEAETRVRTTHDGLAAVRLDLLLPNPTTRTRGMKQAMHLLAAFDLPHDPHWQTKPAFQKVPAEQRAALSSDLGELLLLVANARLKEGKTADRAGSVNDARLLNELARGCFGDTPPPWLSKQRAELDGKTVEAAAAKSARDHFLDGASLYSQMKFDVAVRPLEKAVAGEPDHGAANFLLARCQHHVGNFEAAVERYKSAAALLPKDPRPVYFSGIALWLSDHHSSSEEAYSAAIELDDNYADAYIARGIANLEVQDYRNADRDFTKALERGAAKLQVHTLRAHARAGMNNAEGETEDRKVAAGLEAEDEQDFLTRGYTLFKTAPRKALADFQSAIEKNPDSLTARRNQVLILADELRDDAAALKAADELAKFFPQYSQGRAIRALVLARLGRRDEAIQEAAACRKLLTAKGPNFRDERVVYRLAVVHAVVARSAEERSDAIRILKEALRAGFSDFAGLENERDLASIRELPEFQLAVESAKELGN